MYLRGCAWCGLGVSSRCTALSSLQLRLNSRRDASREKPTRSSCASHCDAFLHVQIIWIWMNMGEKPAPCCNAPLTADALGPFHSGWVRAVFCVPAGVTHDDNRRFSLHVSVLVTGRFGNTLRKRRQGTSAKQKSDSMRMANNYEIGITFSRQEPNIPLARSSF